MARYESYTLSSGTDFGSFLSSRFQNLSPNNFSMDFDSPNGSLIIIVQVN